MPSFKVNEEEICSYKMRYDDLSPEDIYIRKFNINMGMKEENPLQNVSFYKICDEGKQIVMIKK